MAKDALPISQTLAVRMGPIELPGDLTIPPGAKGLVVFVHGSGSSRFSSRNRFVASQLNEAGFGTLLFDLLTEQENEVDERTRELRFDIALLSRRLIATVDWLAQQPRVAGLTMGLFGASTGAAAALSAAAARPGMVGAVVSRGGRPDLAKDDLDRVQSPVLLIVGGNDQPVIAMNREAMSALRCETQIEIVPGATHLFEEPGTLEQVAHLAAQWFKRYLPGGQAGD